MKDLFTYVQVLSWFYGRKVGNERGASAVEYSLLIAGIAAIVALSVFAIGRVVRGTFDNTSSSFATTT